MKRLTTSSCRALLALTLILQLTVTSPAHAVSAKDTWTSVRSKNFFLIGNASERDIKRTAMRLEQFRETFSRLLKRARLASDVPMTVIVFKDDNSYKPFKPLYQGKPANVAGFYLPGREINYITMRNERGAESDKTFQLIFHEYVHALVENNTTFAPLWYNEGLAEYYSTFELTNGERDAQIGKPIDYHVYRLRERGIMPLRQLFAVNSSSPDYNERDKQSIFYAQSWAFMHMLLAGNNGQRAPQLSRFIDLLARNTPVEQAFTQAFQTDFQTMEKELKKYVSSNSFPYQTYTFTDGKVATGTEMQSQPVSDAQTQFYLGDLLLHMNRLDEADAHLQQAVKLDVNLSAAYASLGVLRTRQRKLAEAKTYLGQAIKIGAQNHLAYYYYAYALSIEDREEGGLVAGFETEKTEKMRAALKRAIELQPSFTESYHLLAFINLVANEQIDESISLLTQALQKAPGKQEFQLVLAQLYARKDNMTQARAILERLSKTATNPQLRQQAEATLTRINAYAERTAQSRNQTDDDGNNTSPPAPRDNNNAATNGGRGNVVIGANGRAVLPKRTGLAAARGTLTRIECKGKDVIFHVEANGKTFKFVTQTPDKIEFVKYVQGDGGQISCGARQKPELVAVYYRAEAAGKGSDGEPVSVLFIADNFDLEP